MIAVLMTCYNQGAYLSEAIESILLQEKACFHLYVYDDNSTDDSEEILDFYKSNKKITIIKNEVNLGLTGNYRKALEQISEEYISICEGDDVFLDSLKLYKQSEFLKANSDIGMTYSNALVFDGLESRLCVPLRELSLDDLLLYNPVKTATTMFRRVLLDSLDWEHIQSRDYRTIDLLLWLHCAKSYRLVKLDGLFGGYRIHNTSVSHDTNDEKRQRFINSVFDLREDFLEQESLRALSHHRRVRFSLRMELVDLKNNLFYRGVLLVGKFLLNPFLFFQYRWLRA